jgi:hypothetical protein
MTYDDVRAAVSGYMHRTDQETIDNEPTALELARERLSRDFFPESASVLLELAVVAGVAALPDDFGQADTVTGPDGEPLLYELPRVFMRGDGSKGKFTIAGAELRVDGAIASVSLLYYKTAPPVGPGGTNWLSEQFPDVWIWQGVAEQHRFVQDFESAQIAEQHAMQVAADAVMRTRANRGGGSMRMSSRR